MISHTKTTSRLLAKVIWELRKTEDFETLADLTDALKFRCAQLKIPWTPEAITDAYRLIETNTRVTVVPELPPPAPQPEIFPPSRDEARAILDRLGVRPRGCS